MIPPVRGKCPRRGAALSVCALLGLAWLAGCGGGDSLPREAISGSVTFDGKPVEHGTIQLMPDPANRDGIASGGIISGGAFRVARADGPTPGRYLVMIFAGESAEKAAAPPQPESPGQPAATASKSPTGLIPPRYNMATELAVEVKSGGGNTFTFDLKK